MIRVFPPSTIPHPWIHTWAMIARIAYATIGLYILFVYLLPWAAAWLGWTPWTWEPVRA